MLTAKEKSFEELLKGKSHKTIMQLCQPDKKMDLDKIYDEEVKSKKKTQEINETPLSYHASSKRLYAQDFKKRLEELKHNGFIDFAQRHYNSPNHPGLTSTIDLLSEYMAEKRRKTLHKHRDAQAKRLEKRTKLFASYNC